MDKESRRPGWCWFEKVDRDIRQNVDRNRRRQERLRSLGDKLYVNSRPQRQYQIVQYSLRDAALAVCFTGYKRREG